jgi:hypothetical protein
MKNRSILALSIVFAPILASLCVPFSASANGWERASKIDHGLIAGTPKTDPTVPVSFGSQGDDGIRPVTPGNERIGNTDTGVKPVTPRIQGDDSIKPNGDDGIRPVSPGNERIGNTDTGVKPVTPGNQRIGTDDSVKPIRSKLVTPNAKISTQNDDGI